VAPRGHRGEQGASAGAAGASPHSLTPTALPHPLSHPCPRALQAADDARKAREAALNDLEGYIYKVNHTVEEEEEEDATMTPLLSLSF